MHYSCIFVFIQNCIDTHLLKRINVPILMKSLLGTSNRANVILELVIQMLEDLKSQSGEDEGSQIQAAAGSHYL